ncbi:MAG TPA: amidohydrolase [Candidatus Fimivicinus intestinavium]|nr:amidohydrolase [Candidatus Fimivicinus intestinavium]
MVIDAHAHIFPEKIARKATEHIGQFYGCSMAADGTVANLLRWGDQYGVDRFVVHSVATTVRQVDSINGFIASQVELHPQRLIGFAALHPDSGRIAQQVEQALQMGLTGVKLHPDFQEFYIDEEKAFPIYEAIEGRMPLLIHTGDSRTEYSKPWRLARVLERFPKLDVIAAHFGGYSEWENGALSLSLKNVYVDTSSSQFVLTPHQVRELIDIFGADHVLFGTDYPMWNPEEELQKLSLVPMTQQEREWILHGNLERLLAKYQG